MKLRRYKQTDAKEIIKWINSEKELRLWSADRYKSYPITSIDINNNYEESMRVLNFYPLTLENEGKVIGHLILRNPGNNENEFRLGFIIVDSNARGKGYGKKIILEAIKYAKNELSAKKFNLGVFLNNENAVNCYKAVGFNIIEIHKDFFEFYDEKWDYAEMVL